MPSDAPSHRSAAALVNAIACQTQLVLGQVSVADKFDEIIALRALVDLLDLSATTVTADAMHCQKETTAAILRKGGNYALALKGNQSGIVADVDLLVADRAIRRDDEAGTTDVSMAASKRDAQLSMPRSGWAKPKRFLDSPPSR